MSQSPILLLNKKIALRYEFEVLTSEFQILMDWTFWFPCIRKTNPSESPILFYLYYEIALRIGSSIIKIWNSDGLAFLILLYQKVQSIRKSNSVLSLVWDCSEVWNWKFCYQDLKFWLIGLSDSTVSESPIHQKVQFCSIFIMRLLWGMKL